MSKQADGIKIVDFISRDLKNYLLTKRKHTLKYVEVVHWDLFQTRK